MKNLDRKTVRCCLRTSAFRPHQAAAQAGTVLSEHAERWRRGRSCKIVLIEFRSGERQERDAPELVVGLDLGDTRGHLSSAY